MGGLGLRLQGRDGHSQHGDEEVHGSHRGDGGGHVDRGCDSARSREGGQDWLTAAGSRVVSDLGAEVRGGGEVADQGSIRGRWAKSMANAVQALPPQDFRQVDQGPSGCAVSEDAEVHEGGGDRCHGVGGPHGQVGEDVSGCTGDAEGGGARGDDAGRGQRHGLHDGGRHERELHQAQAKDLCVDVKQDGPIGPSSHGHRRSRKVGIRMWVVHVPDVQRVG